MSKKVYNISIDVVVDDELDQGIDFLAKSILKEEVLYDMYGCEYQVLSCDVFSDVTDEYAYELNIQNEETNEEEDVK